MSLAEPSLTSCHPRSGADDRDVAADRSGEFANRQRRPSRREPDRLSGSQILMLGNRAAPVLHCRRAGLGQQFAGGSLAGKDRFPSCPTAVRSPRGVSRMPWRPAERALPKFSEWISPSASACPAYRLPICGGARLSMKSPDLCRRGPMRSNPVRYCLWTMSVAPSIDRSSRLGSRPCWMRKLLCPLAFNIASEARVRAMLTVGTRA